MRWRNQFHLWKQKPWNIIGFASIYHITKEIASGREPFNGPIRDFYNKFLIHDDEQLKRWKGDTSPPKSIRFTFSDIAKYRNIQVWITSSNRSKMMSMYNELKRDKGSDINTLPAELFIRALAFLQNFCISIFENAENLREWKSWRRPLEDRLRASCCRKNNR